MSHKPGRIKLSSNHDIGLGFPLQVDAYFSWGTTVRRLVTGANQLCPEQPKGAGRWISLMEIDGQIRAKI
jgi:hypothetical protein